MKVLNVCTDDWANFMYDNMKSLHAVGVNCHSAKLNPHVCNYKNESCVVKEQSILNIMYKYDVIQIFHSDVRFLNHATKLKKKIIVYHTGTVYRVGHEQLNLKFNPWVHRSVIALGELMGLGSAKETYMVGACETQNERKEIVHPFKVAHYPSNHEIKGTKDIIEIMSVFKHFDCSTERIDHKFQIDRMNQCDVYIELFSPTNNGKKYGSWGITALEAASLGKIVITQNLSKNVYEKHYGSCPFILLKEKNDLIKVITDLMTMGATQLNVLGDETKNWFEEKHSHMATGQYILKNIFNGL